MKKLTGLILIVLLLAGVFSGCTGSRKEIIDLDKVLDVMQASLDELNKTTPIKTDFFTDVPEDVASSTSGNDSFLPIPPEKQSNDFNRTFTAKFENDLNAAGLSKNRIGVNLAKDGSVEGYPDYNKNFKQDVNEKTMFKVEIDVERNRLIATDTQNQYRRSSGYSFAQGMFASYLLSSMLGRQRSAGIRSSRFAGMKMSSPNYRKSALSKFKRSARSSGGSRSFKGGK